MIAEYLKNPLISTFYMPDMSVERELYSIEKMRSCGIPENNWRMRRAIRRYEKAVKSRKLSFLHGIAVIEKMIKENILPENLLDGISALNGTRKEK